MRVRCVLNSSTAAPAARVVYVPPQEAPRVVHVRQVTLLLRGRRHRGARARARCRGGCSCEQRPDWYYRFTLEGEAAPPPLAAD